MRAVDSVVAALASQSRTPTSWIVGEPCFDPPPELIDALAHAAKSRAFNYPPPGGIPKLRKIMAAHLEEEGLTITPSQITTTNGAKCGLFALFSALLNPGDELIHPRPCYPAYPAIAKRIGAKPIAVAEPNDSFSGWAGDVAKHINARTRAVVLASPSNPTGSTLDASEAHILADLCNAHGIRLIVDEAYTDFRFTGNRHTLPADMDVDFSTVVRVRSASKSWAVCGWRLGWIIADVSLTERVTQTHSSLLNPASGPAQMAMCALPRVSANFQKDARSIVAHRKDELCSALADAGIPFKEPEGGFYVWLKVGKSDQSVEFNATESVSYTHLRAHETT